MLGSTLEQAKTVFYEIVPFQNSQSAARLIRQAVRVPLQFILHPSESNQLIW